MTVPPAHRSSPYKGLVPYDEDDASYFFGRERDTRLIAANLFASPLTLLYGASGVGKSSVLRAGVAHQLKQRDDLLVIVFNAWQGDPLADLRSVIELAAREVSADNFTPPPSSTLAEYLAACSTQLGRRVMLILDQFEEYFLYHPQNDAFSEELPRAVMLTDAPVSFLISLREDALAKLDRFEGRIPTLFDNYLRIEHLSLKAGRAAILKPIEEYNRATSASVTIEPELVEAILEQVRTGEVILGETGQGVVKSEAAESQIETPYLQMVMMRLWDEEMRKGSSRLRLETLNELGGAKSIVRTHLDTAMSTLPLEKQDVAARVFRYLVTPSGSKIAHTIPDLAALADTPQQQLSFLMKDLLGGDVRILRGVAPPIEQPDEPRYEIFHDVLAPAILDWRSRFVKTQKDAEKDKRLAIEAEERLKAEKQLARERTLVNRFRLSLMVMALLLLAMLAATTFAFVQRAEANSQRASAEYERQRALGQSALALQRRGEAEQSRAYAESQFEEANRQKNDAEQARAKAEEQTRRAEAQTRRAEEQKRIADEERRRTVKAGEIDVLARKALEATRERDTDKAKDYFETLRQEYKKAGNPAGEADAIANLADLTLYPNASLQSELVEAMDETKDKAQTKEALETAFTLIFAMALDPSSDEQTSQSQANMDTNRAIDLYRQAKKINESNALSDSALKNAKIQRRLGDAFAFLNRGDEALTNYDDSLSSYRAAEKAATSPESRSKAYMGEALTLRILNTQLLEELGKKEGKEYFEGLNKVIRNYKQARTAYQQAGNPLKAAWMSRKIGEIFLEALGKLPADAKSKTSISEIDEIDLDSLLSDYEEASKIYCSLNKVSAEIIVDQDVAQLYEKQPDKRQKAIEYYKLARDAYQRRALSKLTNNKTTEAESDFQDEALMLVKVLRLSSDSEAENYFEEVIKTYPAKSPGKAIILKGIADAYRTRSDKWPDKQRAIKYYLLERSAWQEMGKTYEALTPLLNITGIYVAAGKKAEAVDKYEEALRDLLGNKIADKSQASSTIRSIVVSLGKLLVELGRDDKAKEAFQSVREYYRKNNPEYEIYLLSDIGEMYEKLKKNDRAIEYYDEQRLMYQQTNYSDIDVVIGKISNLYMASGDKSKAVAYLIGVVNSAHQAGYLLSEAAASANLGNIYRQAKEYENALKYYEQARRAYEAAKEKARLANVLRIMSEIYKEMGNKEKEKEYADLAEQARRTN